MVTGEPAGEGEVAGALTFAFTLWAYSSTSESLTFFSCTRSPVHYEKL